MTKRTYPKPTQLQRGKHILYWMFVALTIIPFAIFLFLGLIAERMDNFLGQVRRWCFSERYVPRSRLPLKRK